jgi:hypothetical protein
MRAPLPKCPGPVITYDSRATGTLTGFGRTLIAQSKQFVIQVSPPASVTIASDFLEATRYSTSGDTDTIRVNLGFGARQPYFERVKVRTGWRETSLVQTLSSETGGVGFKMTRTFLPTADGRQLFLIIQVLAPTLKPPVADITRTYVRLHTP